MKSEDLLHNKDSSQQQDDDEQGDTSRAGTYDEGSVDGSEGGESYPQNGIAPGSSVNGSSSSTHGVGKEPRKLQRPIQRGAQACEFDSLSYCVVFIRLLIALSYAISALYISHTYIDRKTATQSNALIVKYKQARNVAHTRSNVSLQIQTRPSHARGASIKI